MDEELKVVGEAISQLDPTGERIARVLRQTLDQLYDGQHTGRYRWDQLYKTEKTHCGTLVEINLQREFRFVDGKKMDFCIEGIEVDCKYSQTIGGWMIPNEAVGHLCMLISADDQESTWSMGVVRVVEAILTSGRNRDSKRTISAEGRKQIHWVFKTQTLPPNILLQLDPQVVKDMMELPSGQQRIDQIFRVAQGQRIGRGVIATLGQQDDYMKRVRGNGGSRSRLQREGIIILGHYRGHQKIAAELGVPIPGQGESVSARVFPADEAGHGVSKIGDQLWRIAQEFDPIVRAPDCQHTT